MSDTVLTRRAAIAAVLMAAAAAGGQAMVPTRRMALLRGPFKLDDLVPLRFGNWRVDPRSTGGIVDPTTEALLNKLYSQMLSRFYVDDLGHQVMLSIAYGADQADDDVQLHYPEVCYPAQGFQVKSNRTSQIDLPEGVVRVKQLETQQLAIGRYEPVTYWTIVGDQQSLSGLDRKIAEIRHGLHGEIVDGLLFRVSTLGRDSEQGFLVQNGFIRDLVRALTPAARRQLVGLA
jgi:EpsI family protein